MTEIKTKEETIEIYRNELKEYKEEWKNKDYDKIFYKESISFGKYKGNTWDTIRFKDKYYIGWLLRNNIIKDNVIYCIRLYFKIRHCEDMISYILSDNNH